MLQAVQAPGSVWFSPCFLYSLPIHALWECIEPSTSLRNQAGITTTTRNRRVADDDDEDEEDEEEDDVPRGGGGGSSNRRREEDDRDAAELTDEELPEV